MGRTGRLFGLRARRGRARHHDAWPRRSATACRSGPCWPPRTWRAAFTPGNHGSTFGGNPFATAVGLTVFTTLMEERLPERAAATGRVLREQLEAVRARHPKAATAVRGRGLLVGMDLVPPVGEVIGGLPRARPARAERGRQHSAAGAAPDRGRGRGAARGRDHRPGPGRLREVKHFLSIRDLARRTSRASSRSSPSSRPGTKARDRSTPLPGRTMALIFEKPSLRTRVTFEVAITQLGGSLGVPLRAGDRDGQARDGARRRPQPLALGGRGGRARVLATARSSSSPSTPRSR